MGRFVSRRPIARGKARKTTWIGTADQGYVAIGANANVIHQSLILDTSAIVPSSTLVRSRGVISIQPNVYSADLDVVGAVGMRFVSDSAFAVGATAIPGPISANFDDAWFVFEPFAFRYDVTTDVGRLLASVQIMYDSKAMRKTADGETLVVMVESQAAAFDIAINGRFLFKLS